jgi:cytidylate kinase
MAVAEKLEYERVAKEVDGLYRDAFAFIDSGLITRARALALYDAMCAVDDQRVIMQAMADQIQWRSHPRNLHEWWIFEPAVRSARESFQQARLDMALAKHELSLMLR